MSEIRYKDEILCLTDEFTDVGYMAENFEALDVNKESITIKRSHTNHAMSVFISLPIPLIDEIFILDEFLSMVQVEIYCYVVFSHYSDEVASISSKLKTIKPLFDEFNEFGELYGTQIESGSLASELCKSLFLVSKDGAIFYIDMPQDLQTPLDRDRLQIELNKAYLTYTGVGCHG